MIGIELNLSLPLDLTICLLVLDCVVGAEPHSVQRQEIIEGLHLARSTEEPVGSGTQLRQYKAYQSHVEAETGRQGSAIATAAR